MVSEVVEGGWREGGLRMSEMVGVRDLPLMTLLRCWAEFVRETARMRRGLDISIFDFLWCLWFGFSG